MFGLLRVYTHNRGVTPGFGNNVVVAVTIGMNVLQKADPAAAWPERARSGSSWLQAALFSSALFLIPDKAFAVGLAVRTKSKAANRPWTCMMTQ